MQETRVILELQKIYSPRFLPLMETFCVCVKGTICQGGMQKGESRRHSCQQSVSVLSSHLLFHLVKFNTKPLLKFQIFGKPFADKCQANPK